jgi:hypothetical protein
MRNRLYAWCLAAAFAFTPIGGAQAQLRLDKTEGWKLFEGGQGLNVRYPAGVFSVDDGVTERGVGRKFKSQDARYQFAAYALANTNNETPRAYLQKNLLVPQSDLTYRRATKKFFVVSSIRDGWIFYSRCNFAGGIYCIYLEYPQPDKVAWDGIVSRVSYSLRPR